MNRKRLAKLKRKWARDPVMQFQTRMIKAIPNWIAMRLSNNAGGNGQSQER